MRNADALSRGWFGPLRVEAPATGCRCPRCHNSRRPTQGCGLCAPERIPLFWTRLWFRALRLVKALRGLR